MVQLRHFSLIPLCDFLRICVSILLAQFIGESTNSVSNHCTQDRGGVVMNAGAYGGEMAQVLVSVTALDLDGSVHTIPAESCGLGYRKSVFSDGQRLVLEARFQLSSGDPSAIRARMDELAARRKEKQPLEYPSAGSMFKRPEGYFAAALIDQCGLKGFAVGGAQVSEKHAGFVVNRGGATCADVLELVRQVQARVQEQTGVALEMEVKVLR